MTSVADQRERERGTGAPGRRPAPPRLNRRTFDNRVLPWLLLAPAMVLIFGLVLYPVGRTLWLSLHEAGLASLITGEMDFVGVGNFADIAGDAHLRRVFIVTTVFGLSCVLATMAVGLAIALLLNQRFKGRAVLAILVLLPWAVPRVAAAIVWRWIYNDQYGIANWALAGLGLDMFEGYAWFNRPLPAFFAIGVVVVWQSFPFVAISLLAGFQSVSEDVVEASKVDGASPWQRLRFVTLPMLKPLILVLVVISTIWNFKVFDQVFVMTGGGPARQTEVIAIATWREAFTRLDFGIASALAVLLFIVLTLITIVYIRLVRDDEDF